MRSELAGTTKITGYLWANPGHVRAVSTDYPSGQVRSGHIRSGQSEQSHKVAFAIIIMSSSSSPPQQMGKSIKFLFGGSAGMMATFFVQPLDLVKNRMQLSGMGGGQKQYKTSFHALTSILKNEGVTGIYTGLSAGLLRQATYTTTRLGIYSSLFDMFSKDGKPPNFITKALIGVTAGGVGAFVGTPAEVALIRMTADGRLPAAERRGYKSVFDALARIIREEGLFTLWRGCIPTVGRAMVVNAAQLASYSQAKQILLST
ncbi:mitochondrial 2-oxoglutarate/malate carrier protein, partial [Plakobranchus ocellatus]